MYRFQILLVSYSVKIYRCFRCPILNLQNDLTCKNTYIIITSHICDVVRDILFRGSFLNQILLQMQIVIEDYGGIVGGDMIMVIVKRMRLGAICAFKMATKTLTAMLY
ncbi:hypothetical protein RCL_jg29349.t1 [Rhizophagus clarus]|uniref:Uncharacterized protein n=1 Tax=Rhizophagus clarus TaxID=94130 RepID=A0A8H3L221_9GLOM|nr:hypothetical protein RCL_jg29349.t1 [Rhizophagus clarus]